MKKISIILTTYNCRETLPVTLRAIGEQDYPDIEVIIKDGGSSDGTVELIREYAGQASAQFHDPILWKSCPDEGIYDAMNQGYELSQGDYILFLNDRLTRPDALSLMMQAIESEQADGAHADLVYEDENGQCVRYWRMSQGTIRQGWMPGHPTLLLDRRVYERYGLYRTDFRISADYEFMVRILKDGAVKLAYVPEVLVSMYYGGTSTGGLSGYLKGLREAHEALTDNHVRGAFLVDIRRTLRVLRQFRTAKGYIPYTADETHTESAARG